MLYKVYLEEILVIKEDKYLVLKIDDISKLLDDYQKDELWGCIDSIKSARKVQGKRDNRYVVVNEDEPYSWVVWKLIKIKEHNPNGLEILMKNLEVEFSGYDI